MENKSLLKTMAKLFLPIFLELTLITLLSTVDTIMLSRYDQLAVNAVGTASTTLSLFSSLLIISGNGVAILVGQFLGGKKEEDAKKVLAQGVMANFALGLVLFLLFFFLAGPLLRLANAKDSFFEMAKSYIRIYSFALPFQAVTQVIGADFRARGKPQYMTYVSIASNLINVLLNYLLIYGVGIFPELGIKGAAIATLVSLVFKTAAGIVLETKIIRDPLFAKKPDKAILLGVLKIGGPSALETVCYTVFSFLMTAALNRLTDIDIGSKVYINMVLSYTFIFSSALAATNSILVARFVGAHDYQSAKKLTLKTMGVGIGIMVVIIGIVNLVGMPLFTWLSGEEVYAEAIVKTLPLLFLLEIGRATNMVVISAQKASGDVIFPLVIGVISMSLVMAGGSWLFTEVCHLGLFGIVLAQASDEFLRGIVSLIRWLSDKWMHHSLIKEEPASSPYLEE